MANGIMKTIVGKLVILGDGGVGKTSLITRYTQKAFNLNISSTIGASFFTCKTNIDNAIVRLQIWDTAGQERFKAMTPMFYRNANAALLVFDITCLDSFGNMQTWAQQLKGNVVEPMVLCVIGNKIDLSENRVSREEALQYANSIGAQYFECSAKEDQGIGQVFETISRDLIRLSSDSSVKSLKVYEGDVESALMARSTDLEATDVGRIEEPGISIDSIAHAKTVPSKCCY
ncbi:PREDICTED: ras-related protein Rab-31-like isoform X2 [Nicrophorus vespilloides]|uniref:Ras-related protein Rab-31-like isoform X2 n=1 Tax=Nicrophorus vespilloides TaxID=110193 RepID=A0ABM1MPI3_NICVS|nr:PREDICTED: ras-related protein Rab-31-like isoform X2 [Nicrophorus vespilloides]